VELSTPFLVSLDKNWHPIYACLCGTQLSIYRLKSPRLFKSSSPTQGRLLRTYSLQHAEIGLAADHNNREIVPRSVFAKMVPKAAQKKLWETDPQLFEPLREYVIRLRLEGEQLLLFAETHANMLDWLELLGAGIDIAQPLEDRSEPRYRSLPRRTRRQRQIEANALENRAPVSNEELEMRLIAQQQRLFRRLYPQLATATSTVDTNLERIMTNRSEGRRDVDRDGEGVHDPEAEDLDPADVHEDSGDCPSSRPTTAQRPASPTSLQEASHYDPKTTPERVPMATNALCRFRRRCAPILLASSPRASPIIFLNHRRFQIDPKREQIVPFEIHPPRYDATASTPLSNLASAPGDDQNTSRPTLDRGITTATFASGASQWTTGSTEEEHAEHDGFSLHSSGSGELSRVSSTVTGKSHDATVAKGNGKALLLSVRKITMPAKRLHGDHEVDTASAAAVGTPQPV
jgi:hypothetical protein